MSRNIPLRELIQHLQRLSNCRIIFSLFLHAASEQALQFVGFLSMQLLPVQQIVERYVDIGWRLKLYGMSWMKYMAV